jgi:hypothetical protein
MPSSGNTKMSNSRASIMATLRSYDPRLWSVGSCTKWSTWPLHVQWWVNRCERVMGVKGRQGCACDALAEGPSRTESRLRRSPLVLRIETQIPGTGYAAGT